jgi:hypothetical protein
MSVKKIIAPQGSIQQVSYDEGFRAGYEQGCAVAVEPARELRDVYEAVRRVLRFEGVDPERASSARKELEAAMRSVDYRDGQ